MNPLVLATPIVAMACLLILMQRIETNMTRAQKVPVEARRTEPRTRAEVTARRSGGPSPLLAAAPVVLTLVAAVLAGGMLVRLAS
jgi:hypothetical protein